MTWGRVGAMCTTICVYFYFVTDPLFRSSDSASSAAKAKKRRRTSGAKGFIRSMA